MDRKDEQTQKCKSKKIEQCHLSLPTLVSSNFCICTFFTPTPVFWFALFHFFHLIDSHVLLNFEAFQIGSAQSSFDADAVYQWNAVPTQFGTELCFEECDIKFALLWLQYFLQLLGGLFPKPSVRLNNGDFQAYFQLETVFPALGLRLHDRSFLCALEKNQIKLDCLS